MLPKETLDRIVELAVTPVVNDDGDKEFIIAPSGTQLHDVSKFFPPSFIESRIVVETAEAFVDYLNRFKTDNSILFASVTDLGATIRAIIDYHGNGSDGIGRCVHTVEFATTQTAEWKIWMEHNRKTMSQLEFAVWLEDNQHLFNNPEAKPTGAELLELVLNLEGKQHVDFQSVNRLDNGRNRIEYNEEITLKGQTATTTKEGAIELPKELLAGIAPFQGAAPYAVRARLKYRIQGRNLTLWYETIAPHVIIRDSVKAVLKVIEDGTKMKPIQGRKNA